MHDGDSHAGESECRQAENEKRFAEEMRPPRAPEHHRAQAHRRERCEVETAGARKVPRGDREVPVVENGKFAVRTDEDDGHRPHAQNQCEIDEIAAAHHAS